MIESIQFTNCKALRKTTLPLAPFTLLLGPNGSGKTSVLQALQRIAARASAEAGLQTQTPPHSGPVGTTARSVTVADASVPVEVRLHLRFQDRRRLVATFRWHPDDVQGTLQLNDGEG